MEPPRIAGFELGHLVGAGGMGEVWHAIHRASGTAVALKLITSAHAREARWIRSFRQEARAIARLDHANIVRILDYGEDARDGVVIPWLALDLADGGSLDQLRGAAWPDIAAAVTSLLDALAHAHARGIVHRDVKPSNALFIGDRVALSDFGLAHLASHRTAPDATDTMGTPALMAPEQFTGRWRDHGPWTDLYALGCLVWALVTGEPPFGWTRTPAELLEAHNRWPVPPFEPSIDVPAGLEEWLRGLLHKKPRHRPARAAEAAWHLGRLGPVADASTSPRAGATLAPPRTRTVTRTADVTTDVATFSGDLATPAAEPERAGHELAARAPLPIPVDWRLAADAATRMVPRSTGIGVYRLRTVPIVGREALQDALWAELVAAATGSARVCVLAGPAGVGKTRLAAWLAERAHELGVAEVFWINDPARGPGAVVEAAVEAAVGPGAAADPEGVHRWLTAVGIDAHAFAHAVNSALTGGIATHAEHVAVAQRLVRLATAHRTPLLVVDDAPSVEVVTALEAIGGLVIATTRGASGFDGLAVTVFDVEPLQPAAQTRLIRDLLGLTGELAAVVEERAAGNPMFAVELVGGWVDDGSLVASETGYRLAPGVEPSIPDALLAIWRGRLAPHRDPALEVAACLGLRVDTAELEAACEAAGVPFAGIAELVASGLATIEGGRVVLCHAFVRDALLSRATDAPRWHAACAQVVEDPARRGSHLRRAGRPAQAIQPLLDGARDLRRRGDLRGVLTTIAEREVALRDCRIAEGDLAWAEGWLERAHALRLRGHIDEASALTSRILDSAQRPGSEDVLASAWLAVSGQALDRGDLAASEHGARQALAAARSNRQRAQEVMALMHLGNVARRLGDPPQMARWLELAASAAEHLGDPLVRAQSLQALSLARGATGDRPGALRATREAIAIYEAAATWMGVATCAIDLGNLLRLEGDTGGAVAEYRRALELYEQLGSGDAYLPRLNLALSLLDTGRYAEARPELERVLHSVRQQGRRGMAGAVHACLLPIAAWSGSRRAWRGHLQRATELLDETGFVDPTIGWVCELAATVAVAGDLPDWAEEARALAARHRRSSG